jgi:chromosome transmission fidelity protein 1
MERYRRELEAEDAEYEERLAIARKKEASMKKMAKARVTKKPVRDPNAFGPSITYAEGICIEINP